VEISWNLTAKNGDVGDRFTCQYTYNAETEKFVLK